MKRMMQLRTFALLALGLLVQAAAVAGTLQQVLARGELRVGISLATPWAMRNEDTGELSGFEIDVANRLAADMDVDVRFVRYDYDELVRALEANEVDLIAAGLTISTDRLLHVNFSRPYARGGVFMATNIAATAEVERLEELNAPAWTIAVMADTVSESLARRVFPRARIEPYRSETDATAALVGGDADVFLEEDPFPSFLALEYPRVVDAPLSQPLLETRSAFAVTKGDPDFVFFLNGWIEAREADTWLPTRYEYWFRTLQWRD